MMQEKHWSIHIEFAVLLITILSGFYILCNKIENQTTKTHKLYLMFIDLLKEGKRR